MATSTYAYAVEVARAWDVLVSRLALSSPRLTYKDLDNMLPKRVGPRNVGCLILGPIQNFCLQSGWPDITVLVGRSMGKGKIGNPGIDFFCNGVGSGYGRPKCPHGTGGILPFCHTSRSVPAQRSVTASTLASVLAFGSSYPVSIPVGFAASLPRRHAC